MTTKDVLDAYVDHVMSFIDPSVIRPFNVVLDAGSGMGGLVAPKLFERLPCRTTRLCFEIDGRFPNHEANPLIEENRRDIVERGGRREGGHRHRLGRRRRPLLLHRRHRRVHLRRFHHRAARRGVSPEASGATIIYDLRASHAVRDVVAQYGGTSLMNRVGHAFFKRRMRETNAIFGGEVTGHYYFRDNFYADNGFIPALLMLELMSKKGQSLHELLEPLRAQLFHLGRDQHEARRAWTRCRPSSTQIAAQVRATAQQYKLDGISVEYPDWHFNVRPSNTEPLLRLNLEATTPEMMAAKRDEVVALIRS